MTNQEHPITPPPELWEQWYESADDASEDVIEAVATQAARWGADAELEACCEWFLLEGWHPDHPNKLRAARRPKPPTLKAQALEELEKVDMLWDTTEFIQETLNSLDTIRRALEQLDD